MSHFAEREEKKCLNCYSELSGRYCRVCGQENIEPKETVWHLITHFAYDITHFDGKFFTTAKYLLLRPGFLSHEYIKGRRASYLNPIRMYVFISAVFFLVFFSFFKPEISPGKENKQNKEALLNKKLTELNAVLSDTSYNNDHGAQLAVLKKKMDSVYQLKPFNQGKDSLPKTRVNYGHNYTSIKEYDSVQKKLPTQLRDGLIKRIAIKRSIKLKETYGDDANSLLKNAFDHFLHSFPQIFFISLPLFALLLNLLYYRKKQIYYVGHIIYSIHLYCAVFIMMFLLLCLGEVDDYLWGILTFIEWILGIYMLWYFYKSLRNFYEQSRRKTIFKLILLLFMQGFVLSILFIIFFLASIFSL